MDGASGFQGWKTTYDHFHTFTPSKLRIQR